MKKYKIIFTDIDGTLNPPNEPVSKHTIEVLTKLKEKGIIVVIDSGRCVSYAKNKAIEANLSQYVIASNGAEVYDYENDKTIFHRSLPKETIKEIYKYCEDHDLTVVLNCLNKRFISKENTYNSEPAILFNNIDEVLKDNEVDQFTIFSSNFDRMLSLPGLFKEKFPNVKVVHSSKSLIEERRGTKGRLYFHDLVMEHTAKCTGINELLEYLKINPEEALCIGDGYDDIPMTDVVGTSIAMGNANNLLKEKSTYIADTASNEGLAKILEELFLL